MNHTSLVFLVLLGTASSGFASEEEDIRRLAVERVRSAPADYERVIVAAESRLRGLYGNDEGKESDSPTPLDKDLAELRGACQKIQRLAAAGRTMEPDAVARQIVERRWGVYRGEITDLLRMVSEKKREGASESRIYWETLRAFKDLRGEISTDLLFNTPPGERGLEEALERDETTLLKVCETAPKKTRGNSLRVVAPHEHAGSAQPDIQAFYRSLDLVPDTRPVRTGSFSVPPGSRTVTLREDGARLVFRPRRGKGVAYFGRSETELVYGYLTVPPDTAYYFENTGDEPLELEFVGIKP